MGHTEVLVSKTSSETLYITGKKAKKKHVVIWQFYMTFDTRTCLNLNTFRIFHTTEQPTL